MEKKVQNPEIQKQIEYYLGDKNLSKDDFFRDKITSGKGGYIDLKLFLNCNKIKSMGIDVKMIVEACSESKEVEVSKDKKMIRRLDNKELPAKTGSMKKRDSKANGKEESKAEKLGKKVLDEEEAEVVARDDMGRIMFIPEDFDMENTLILHFKTDDQAEGDEDKNYKV